MVVVAAGEGDVAGRVEELRSQGFGGETMVGWSR